MNTRAIISMIRVPNIPHAELSTPVAVFDFSASSCDGQAFHLNSISIHQNDIVFNVVASGVLGLIIFLTILFFGFHIMLASSHHVVDSILGASQVVTVFVQEGLPPDTAFIIISPNDRDNPTIAGTNASPMNSLIVKLSLLSHHIRLDPATNRNVNRGENIAYTHSLIALTRSIATRARVRSPKTINMIAATIP